MGGELVAECIGYDRAGRSILDGFSMRVSAGEMVAVTGPSGSGKSTLLMLLAGLEPPDRGSITFGGAPIPTDGQVGVVLQSYGLLSLLTAAENVEIVLQTRRVAPAEVRRRAARALTDLGLDEHASRLVDELSGGQQQRVAMARALVVDPPLLLVDEPTAELDQANQSIVMDAIHATCRRGAIVVMATHDPKIAARCTSVVRLCAGRAG